MAFSKSFPRRGKTNYPVWEDIYLTGEEESAVEREARVENNKLMKECLDDAKAVLAEKQFKSYQADVIRIAISLFEKRASHAVWCKERKCRNKFDEKFPQ